MAHTCHAIGCGQRVSRELFMCKRHWLSLPQMLRKAIWATYRPGQCDDLNITAAYARAAKASIRSIASKEQRPVTGKEPELTLYDALVDSGP